MPLFGPYKIGQTIPDTALVGFDQVRSELYAVVGEFSENISVVPAFTDRQQFNGFGVILDDVYVGPDTPSRVTTWGMVPKN